ncbi:MAG: TetR/AcrR family transcriptional regulator [Chloroflexi bacterium]|nr:MAG: TetR/AcrR family transcriptional regulator [Chloroflexota bacterium]
MQQIHEQRRSQIPKRQLGKERVRERIVDAAIELHTSIGPARTTISDIARRAGVQRLTVYRYFPDELSLLGACSGTYRRRNPPPDPEDWVKIADPEERLALALPGLLRYYRRTAPMLSRILRDVSVAPLLRQIAGPRLQWAARVQQVLEAGWNVRGKRRRLLRAAIWRSRRSCREWSWRRPVRGRDRPRPRPRAGRRFGPARS